MVDRSYSIGVDGHGKGNTLVNGVAGDVEGPSPRRWGCDVAHVRGDWKAQGGGSFAPKALYWDGAVVEYLAVS